MTRCEKRGVVSCLALDGLRMEARTSARQAREATRGGEPPPTVAPWSAEAEVELRRKAESDRDHWKREVGRLREELRTVGATISTSSGTIKFMERQSPQFYKEVKVLRGKLARWDERNWVELCVSALAGRNGEADIDYTHDITDCIGFRAELKRIHARRDESCREWLQANAFRLEKQMLAKMAHRISGRRCGWQNSMFKFDHSARDADGARVRRREKSWRLWTRRSKLLRTASRPHVAWIRYPIRMRSWEIVCNKIKTGRYADIAV